MLLHQFLENSQNNTIDRVIAGHLLHMLYVRARWSDLMAVRNAMVDSDNVFFEMETRTHKGAKGAESKSKLLPLASPCIGINGKDWVKPYIDARMDAGLDLPGEEDTHMLPAPSNGAGKLWTSRPLTSEEGANFLRKFLGIVKSTTRRVSTHSMKSTAISWTSKYGLSFEARALLARHASSVSNPTAMYSRDLLSPVLRSFISVIELIYNGQFAPDRTRSGMITPGTPGVGAPCTPGVKTERETPRDKVQSAIEISDEEGEADKPVSEDFRGPTAELEEHGLEQNVVPGVHDEPLPLVKAVVVEDELSETSESIDSSDVSECDDVDDRIDLHQRFAPMTEPSFSDIYINTNSTVLHCIGQNGKFGCGRTVTKSYVKVWELNGIRCSKCFNV